MISFADALKSMYGQQKPEQTTAPRQIGTSERVSFDDAIKTMWFTGSVPKPMKAEQQTQIPYKRLGKVEPLYKAVEWVESRGRANAVSPKGAIGPMQTMPNTLVDPGFGVRPAKDRSVGELRRVGRDYLDAMVGKYGLEGGLAAYNWGPGNWNKALDRAGGDVKKALQSAPKETREYVPKVMSLLQ